MKKKTKKVNAAILIIGDEILSGRTQESNVSFISKWLNDSCGILVEEVRVIPDIEKKLLNVLELQKTLITFLQLVESDQLMTILPLNQSQKHLM